MISIICPTYNSADTLGAFLDSVLCQTADDYELIVVDGGSTDGTLQILQGHHGRVTFVSGKDNGVYDAMNKGIRMAKGEWLYFIGADDVLYDNNVLCSLRPYLTQDTDMILCDIISPTLGRCSSRFSWKTYVRNTIHHQGVVYNRRVFATRMYDASYKILADYDLNLSLWHSGCRMTTADFIFARHMPDGLSGQPNIINYREEIAIRNKYLTNPFLCCLLAGVSYLKYSYKTIRHTLCH